MTPQALEQLLQQHLPLMTNRVRAKYVLAMNATMPVVTTFTSDEGVNFYAYHQPEDIVWDKDALFSRKKRYRASVFAQFDNGDIKPVRMKEAHISQPMTGNYTKRQLDNTFNDAMTVNGISQPTILENNNMDTHASFFHSNGMLNGIDMAVKMDASHPSIRRIVHDEPGAIENFTSFPRLFNKALLIAFGANDEGVKALQAAVEELHGAVKKDLHKTMTKQVKERLLSAYIKGEDDRDVAINKAHAAFQHYPLGLVNFIISGKENATVDGDTVRQYRRQFVEGLISMMPYQDGEKPFRGDNKERDLMLARHLGDILNNVSYGIDAQIYDAIDQGKFPIKLMASKLGVDHLNRKQLASAFASLHPLSESAALVKIPENWVSITEDDGRKINLLMEKEGWNSIARLKSDSGERTFRSYLITQGKAFAKLDGQLANLQQYNYTPDEMKEKRREIEKTRKHMSTQWAWLAKKSDPIEAFTKFNADFKINSTLRDYRNQMNLFLDAIAFRAAYDTIGLESEDAFNICDESFDITFNDDNVKYGLNDVSRESHEDFVWDLDDDDPEKYMEFDDYDVEGFSYDGLSIQGVWNLKEVAHKNMALHKDMTSIVTKLGEHAKGNHHWEGLMHGNVIVGDYEFEPIADRRRLLLEAKTLSHCVYSYLKPAMNGETSIVSVREKDTGDIIATMEITQEENGYNDDEEPILEHSVEQLYGYNNSQVSPDVQAAAEAFIARLDNKVGVHVNVIADQSHEELDDEPTIENAADMHMIPFLTDAVYDAYKALSKYLPSEMSISSVIDNAGLWRLYSESTFGQEMLSVDRISERFNIPLDTVVDNRKTWSVVELDEAMIAVDRHAHSYKHALDRVAALKLMDKSAVETRREELAMEYEDERHDDGTNPGSWLYQGDIEVGDLSHHEMGKLISSDCGIDGLVAFHQRNASAALRKIEENVATLLQKTPNEINLNLWLHNQEGQLRTPLDNPVVSEKLTSLENKVTPELSQALSNPKR